MKPVRNPDSAHGDWYIDTACINCGASRHVAPGLIIEHNDKSVFAKQPGTPKEQLAAWRALLVCPTASVRSETKQPRPGVTIFPQEITSGVWRCGFNALSSFGAHSYFVARTDGNLLIDSPRYAADIVNWFRDAGGLAHILLSPVMTSQTQTNTAASLARASGFTATTARPRHTPPIFSRTMLNA